MEKSLTLLMLIAFLLLFLSCFQGEKEVADATYLPHEEIDSALTTLPDNHFIDNVPDETKLFIQEQSGEYIIVDTLITDRVIIKNLDTDLFSLGKIDTTILSDWYEGYAIRPDDSSTVIMFNIWGPIKTSYILKTKNGSFLRKYDMVDSFR